MRLLHAFGLSLASSGAALSLTGLCATADAQPSYSAAREATIAEFTAPRREGFDKVIVQLPRLSPVRAAARKPAESPAMAAPAPAPAPVAAAAPAPVPPAEPAAVPAAAAASEAIPRDAPAEVEATAPASEPATAAPHAFAPPVAPRAVAPDVEAAPPPAELAAERAPALSAPEAAAPVETSSEPPLASEPPLVAAEAPEGAVIPAPASEGAQSSPPEAVADPSPAMAEAAPVVAQDAPRAPAAEDDQDPGSWSWSLLTFIVALASLAGFAIVRWRQTRGAASPPAAAPAAGADPTSERARAQALLAFMREKLAPTLLATLQKARKRKGSATHAGAEPEPAADWARIATTLRERAGSAVGAPPARAATREGSDVVDAPAPKAETNRWEQDREDGVELLEPGSTSARAIVMNARRKLQAVGER
jgi:hypothetical protein